MTEQIRLQLQARLLFLSSQSALLQSLHPLIIVANLPSSHHISYVILALET